MAGVLTGKRCRNQDLVLEAFEAVFQHSVEVACIAIDEGTTLDAASERKRSVRNVNTAMLNKLPITCQQLCGVARGDTRYTAVMFYERTRLGAAASGHFLEALPPGLPLFSGHTAVTLQNADLRKLRLRDVVSDRIKTVSNLEALANKTDRLKQLIADHTLPDLPAGLPGRVHVFVARMRAICQGLRRVKPETHFKQCRNCECQRIFYAGAATESAVEHAPSPVAGGDQAYWDLVAGGPLVAHEQSEFCTWSCCQQWRRQLSDALPSDDAKEMVADRNCRKEGRARVPEALRACGKRNERAARHLRTIEKECRTFTALSKQELTKQRARRIRSLNIDIGLLYAASVVADSKALSANRVLPGASENWRTRFAFYAKAVNEVAKIYDKHHKCGKVVANLLINEPFLAKLKERASRVF
jgi:hypothetical protein